MLPVNLLFGASFILCLLNTFLLSESNNSSESADYNSTERERLLFNTFTKTNVGGESVLDRENIDLETDVNKVCDRLRELDVVLTKLFNDDPPKDGDMMIKTLKSYNQACSDLLFLSSFDKLKVLDMAQDILEPGGPKFFDISLSIEQVEQKCHWDEHKGDEFYDILKKTYELWNDLWYINNNFGF